MNISDDEILTIIEDTTVALGQILLRHRALFRPEGDRRVDL
jgi:hypothetical protein